MSKPLLDSIQTKKPNVHGFLLSADEFEYLVLVLCQVLINTKGLYHETVGNKICRTEFRQIYVFIFSRLNGKVYVPGILQIHLFSRLTISAINLSGGSIELTACYKSHDGTAKMYLNFLRASLKKKLQAPKEQTKSPMTK